jgi:hypothetical protein
MPRSEEIAQKWMNLGIETAQALRDNDIGTRTDRAGLLYRCEQRFSDTQFAHLLAQACVDAMNEWELTRPDDDY